VQEHIRRGDVFQAVLSQRAERATSASPLAVYRALRRINPSPYLFLLELGELALVGSSPETHVKVEGSRASLNPIAGTTERSPGDAERLLGSEKDRAEHVMLVDLGRNDLGRVCAYGSVEVESFMAVENYSHVMHIVSSVVGTLRPGVDALAALRSVLPAGTLSGAPKVRAMQIIDELEPVKRGGYGGAIGWASYTGELDTCIHIRTVVVKDGVAHVQAGGGTVADAKPDYEFRESEAKAKAVLQAIALAVGETDWP
jgi:anthranilate synthase component 1